VHGNHLFKERAKKLEDMIKMESDMTVFGIKTEKIRLLQGLVC